MDMKKAKSKNQNQIKILIVIIIVVITIGMIILFEKNTNIEEVSAKITSRKPGRKYYKHTKYINSSVKLRTNTGRKK